MSTLSSRLFPRYRFPQVCQARLIDSTSQFDVFAKDISPTGVSFFGQGNWSIGDLVTMEVAPFDQAPIRVQAKIVRSIQDQGQTLFGAQFQSFPLLYQEKLHNLIRSAIFHDQIQKYADASNLRLKTTPQQFAIRLLSIFLTLVFAFAFYRLLAR